MVLSPGCKLTKWISELGGSPFGAVHSVQQSGLSRTPVTRWMLQAGSWDTKIQDMQCTRYWASTEQGTRFRMKFPALQLSQNYINHSVPISCSVGWRMYVCEHFLHLLLHFSHDLRSLGHCSPGSNDVFRLVKEIIFLSPRKFKGWSM